MIRQENSLKAEGNSKQTRLAAMLHLKVAASMVCYTKSYTTHNLNMTCPQLSVLELHVTTKHMHPYETFH